MLMVEAASDGALADTSAKRPTSGVGASVMQTSSPGSVVCGASWLGPV